MTMKSINPTETKAWQALNSHYKTLESVHLKSMFNHDLDRKKKFTINFNDFEFDYSKNRITEQTLKLLLNLAHEVDLESAMKFYFFFH